MTHSPLPWRTELIRSSGGKTKVWIAAADDAGISYKEGLEHETIKANAELVVKAVNAHDDLVAALKFYAEENNHLQCEKYRCEGTGPVVSDWGDLATKTLKKHGLS